MDINKNIFKKTYVPPYVFFEEIEADECEMLMVSTNDAHNPGTGGQGENNAKQGEFELFPDSTSMPSATPSDFIINDIL